MTVGVDELTSIFKYYLRHRPFFLSLIRAKEAYLYQKYLPFRRPVMDLGCGDGFFAHVAFSRHVWSRVDDELSPIDVGLDIKDSRIEEARKLDIYKKLVTYDGRHFPFPDDSFATIVSNSVLEHVELLEDILNETQRVLKPNGLLLVTVMAKPWEEYLFGARLFGDYYKKWMRWKQVHINLFSKRQWDKAFKKSGFKIEKTIGHLSPKACSLIDICHYISLPSLISYKIFGQWVLFPGIAERIYPIKWLVEIISPNVSPNQSGALFYVLRK